MLFGWFLSVMSVQGGAPPAAFVSIRDFGAVGDGKTPDTAALQTALDTVASRGGGEALVPAGNYLTGRGLTGAEPLPESLLQTNHPPTK